MQGESAAETNGADGTAEGAAEEAEGAAEAAAEGAAEGAAEPTKRKASELEEESPDSKKLKVAAAAGCSTASHRQYTCTSVAKSATRLAGMPRG